MMLPLEDQPILLADMEQDDIPKIEYVKDGFQVGRKKYRYRINGLPARSVTEIIECVFGKGKFGAGAWWGQEQGVRGTVQLLETPGLVWPSYDGGQTATYEADHILRLLKEYKLTTNHVRDKAADRGSAIHDAAERYANENVVPNPADFPPEDQGYVRAFARWLTYYRPEFLATEVVVGSAKHLYAGTYDARVRIGDRVGLVDWKTSKRVYDSHLFQVAAYALAAVECGAEPTDFEAVVHLGADGEYKHEESKVTPEMWLAQVAAYYAQKEAEQLRKAA